MNNTLSIQRIGLLYKHYYFIFRNKLLLILVAVAGLITGYHTLIHAFNYKYLGHDAFLVDYHVSSFGIAIFGACLLWSGNAFPGFRNKEQGIDYLILPATSLEKFAFEFINRVIIFILVFPLIYWLFTNLVTSTFHAFNADYTNYAFSYSRLLPHKISNREITLVVSIVLLIPTISFIGATYFKKLPVVKTIVVVFIILAFFGGYIFLLVKGLNVEEYRPKGDRILFMRNEQDAQLAGIWAAILGNIVLLVISYFKVKEKEV